MEVFVPCNTSHCPDISSSCGSSTTDPHNNNKDISMSDLKTCLTELLNTEETTISTSGLASEKKDIGSVVGEFECKDLRKSNCGCSGHEKCLSKCATFPPPRGPKSSDVFVEEKGKCEEDMTAEVSEGNGSAKPRNQCYSRSISLPVPLKSAMKGTRAKQQGESPKKLSVTWAPDVYDPIPTSVSHVPSDKNQRYRHSGKKKYKQKSGGKSSRGSSKSKDKKQGRKSTGGGSSNKLKQPFHVESGVVLSEPHVGTIDYNVVGPDPFCGELFPEGVYYEVALPRG